MPPRIGVAALERAASQGRSNDFVSSVPPEAHRPEPWLGLIRGHWGGVEIRNHWRRDALMGEDRSRSRNPNLLAKLALIRSALLHLLEPHFPGRPLPRPARRLMTSKQ